MIETILRNSVPTWRNITKLARPIDANKRVIIGKNNKSPADFEAYTDNVRIHINLNKEKEFKKKFEDIIIPAYRVAADKLYNVKGSISDDELLKNLAFDLFLFVEFHEQLHPWLCPNSRDDEVKISNVLYQGIKEVERINKTEAMYKVNNCKNLIWDLVLNTTFIGKVSGKNDKLEEKINFVFSKEGRKIEKMPITHYPSGILPILYMMSAASNSTDIPISLIGSMYSTLSFNDSSVRENAMNVFLKDLNKKKVTNNEALDILVKMYKGLVDEIDPKDLKEKGIDKNQYISNLSIIPDFTNSKYEQNQQYYVNAISQIFDSIPIRYQALKGFIKVISKHINLNQKQGSPDPNTCGHGGGGGGSGESGDGDGSGGSGGGEEGDEDGEGEGEAKTPGEMEEDSMAQTLDDLLEGLEGKEADDLLKNAGNASGGSGAGAPSPSVIKKIKYMAIDEYYKKNAEVIEIRNPLEQDVSYNLGSKKVWTLIKSEILTGNQVSKLNQRQIMTFQKMTGLPILVGVGGGYWRLNEYKIKETPLKSYQSELTGIEIPDNWVFIQDSSGTMTGSPSYVGTKNRFDLLNRVKYGFLNGLYDISKTMGKDPMFGVVDFSSRTIYKGMDKLIKIYDARSHPIKEVSLTPQCGGTSCSPSVFDKIKKDLAPGKSIITMVTDGQIYGSTDSLYRKIHEFSKGKNNAFVFIEIASSSSFGNRMNNLSKMNDSVLYYNVGNVKQIKDKLESILIKYD